MSTEKAKANESSKDEYSDYAKVLMTRDGVETVWRCPKTGHWFTKKELADEYAKAKVVTLKKYENA